LKWVINLKDDTLSTDTSTASDANDQKPDTSTTGDTKLDSTVQDQKDKAGQTDTTGQSEDSFFDPSKLPEELVPVYKGMQAAYTKKTQEIAEMRKNAETLKADAEAYTKYKPLIPIVEEMLASKKANEVSPELTALETRLKQEGYSEEAINMMKIGAKVILDQFNQTRATDQENIELKSKISEAEQLDPRLNDESLVYKTEDGKSLTFGELVAKLVFSDPEWRKNPVGSTKEAIKTIDALVGKAKNEGKEELSNSAKAKAQKFPGVSSSPQSAAANSQPKTIQEAAQEAKKELGM